MTTTTTPPTMYPTLSTPPDFPAMAPGETLAGYGLRAMRYALQLDAFDYSCMDDLALEAAADAITHAVTAREISPVTLGYLQLVQACLRRRLSGRRAAAARLTAGLDAWLAVHGPAAGDAGDRPASGPAAGQQAGPGGGSKVPRPIGPRGPVAPAGMRPVPALQLGGDSF